MGFLPLWSGAQSVHFRGAEAVYVDLVTVEGNKQTRTSIILRELTFAEGDTLPVATLAKTLELSENLVLNTGLFNEVAIVFKRWEGASGKVHIHVKVEEAWYLYPIPRFELADRNFNVWWVEQNRSLDRINYGLEFTHLNTTGRRDKFQIGAIFGYTQQLTLAYSLPYINARQTIGIGGEISYARNREVNYATLDNSQAFYNPDSSYVYRRLYSNLTLTLRPGLRTRHQFQLDYQQNHIAEEVALELNPDFFLGGRRMQRFFSLRYLYQFENRDVRFYPWSGSYFSFELEKDGLGFFSDRNALTMRVRYDHHLPFSRRFSLGLSGNAQVGIIRQQQPYNDNRALGFNGNNIRGYEYYVVDGMDMLLIKTSLHFFLWDTNINFGKLMPIPAFRRLPLRFYFSLNNDAGIANDPFLNEAVNPLNGKWLWGGGLGLNIVIFYDKVFRVEYSVNQMGEAGLFLHTSLNI